MKITKENIECFIFDYHEGNLSDSDKAEVLNFIHLHPEYENDFTHWAQSYLHTEDSIKNYGLADVLLQKDIVPWYANKWFISGGSVAALTIGLYSYLFLIPSEIQSKTQEPALTRTEKQVEQIEKSTPSVIGIYPNQVVKNNAELTEKNTTQTAPTIQSNTATFALSNPDTVVVHGKNDPVRISSAVVEQNTATIDTIQNISTQDKNAVQTKKTPAKHKSKLNLKPDNKFIPTNPDF